MPARFVLRKTALYESDIIKYVEKCHIPNFRLVAMRDGLPNRPKSIESGILNLDDSRGSGTRCVVLDGCVNHCSSLFFRRRILQ